MLVFVKTVCGKTLEMHMEKWERLEDLKEKIRDKEGIPPENQRIIFSGLQLYDGQVFYDTCVAIRTSEGVPSPTKIDGIVVHLVTRMRGGGNVVFHTPARIDQNPSGSDDSSDSDLDSDHLLQNGSPESANAINDGTYATRQGQIISEMGNHGSAALLEYCHNEEAQGLPPGSLEVNAENGIHEDDADQILRCRNELASNICSEEERGFDRRGMSVAALMIAAAAFLVPKAMKMAFEELKEGRSIIASCVILLMAIAVAVLLPIQCFKLAFQIGSSSEYISTYSGR